MIKLVKVRGASMAPTLTTGDYMIVTKAWAMRPGFVVLVDHPKYGVIVKRVTSVSGGTMELEGDGPESTSSAALGTIPQTYVRGRVRLVIAPKGLKRL